jgi:hypothetical protein
VSLVLELPEDLESELAAEAEELGLPLAEYAIRLLAGGRVTGSMPANGKELVAYWERHGLIGTRTDILDSPGHARALREQAEKRKRT